MAKPLPVKDRIQSSRELGNEGPSQNLSDEPGACEERLQRQSYNTSVGLSQVIVFVIDVHGLILVCKGAMGSSCSIVAYILGREICHQKCSRRIDRHMVVQPPVGVLKGCEFPRTCGVAIDNWPCTAPTSVRMTESYDRAQNDVSL